jgi:hypothetical protein
MWISDNALWAVDSSQEQNFLHAKNRLLKIPRPAHP